jgi:predicted metal-dependent hydrolase
VTVDVLPTPSLRARNRLAEIVIAALHDVDARRELAALASGERFPDLDGETAADGNTVRVRACAAERALADVPLARAGTALDVALADAAVLFDAGLFFEVHEVLEPLWRDAGTGTPDAVPAQVREPLQGLIQIAVGYQHAVNGNVRGARALLAEGAERVDGRALAGRALDAFASAVRASLGAIEHVDAITIPEFPRATE